jgi:outer membrane receptor protein involved in Fe transport
VLALRAIVIALVLVPSGALVFDTTADAQADVPRVDGAITGRVRTAEDGTPLVGIAVIVRGAGGEEHHAVTGEDGGFRVESLAPGRYRIEAALDGFEPAAVDVEITDSVAPAAAELRLRLARGEVIEVEGETKAQRMRQSAEAVRVVETANAQRQSADLGEVVARTQGVSVRRSGGLGSLARFSLAGLSDDQIRFFLDGVPLELAGFGLGIANVPVDLIDRVEIYRGVVPIRFGADALGGAVNLASDDAALGTHARAAYQVGSFGTHRLALDASQRSEGGVLVRLDGFLDRTRNDYPVLVDVVDEVGRPSLATLDRFHDGYRAAGGALVVGVVDQSWARRLLLRAYATGYGRDLQSNLVMSAPYGEVTYGDVTGGATVRFERALGASGVVDATAGYSRSRERFLDVSRCTYDWRGVCVRENPQAGEIEGRPLDQIFVEHNAFARALVEWRLAPSVALRGTLAPTFTTRTGDERRQMDPAARDPLAAQRDLFTLVSGLEVQLDLAQHGLEGVAFAKDYVQRTRSEEPTPSGIWRDRDRDTHRVGAGGGIRYRLTPEVYGKLSYEWATRLPRPDELFGDVAQVDANLELVPETSHNANLGVAVDTGATPGGTWRLELDAFLRDVDRLIVPLGGARNVTNQNVFSARSMGVELAAGWTSPGAHLALDGNATYQSFRNTSSEGTFGRFEGDRIPHRPYLLANAAARVRHTGLLRAGDELSLGWYSRYVHQNFRTWESAGLPSSKDIIPTQFVHSAVLTYIVRAAGREVSASLEVENLTAERVFDFYGVERPGRAAYVKCAVSF